MSKNYIKKDKGITGTLQQVSRALYIECIKYPCNEYYIACDALEDCINIDDTYNDYFAFTWHEDCEPVLLAQLVIDNLFNCDWYEVIPLTTTLDNIKRPNSKALPNECLKTHSFDEMIELLYELSIEDDTPYYMTCDTNERMHNTLSLDRDSNQVVKPQIRIDANYYRDEKDLQVYNNEMIMTWAACYGDGAPLTLIDVSDTLKNCEWYMTC